jgi:hypothetical protein
MGIDYLLCGAEVPSVPFFMGSQFFDERHSPCCGKFGEGAEDKLRKRFDYSHASKHLACHLEYRIGRPAPVDDARLKSGELNSSIRPSSTGSWNQYLAAECCFNRAVQC